MRTADRVEITPGLRVWTSDLCPGTVTDGATFTEAGEGWFYVLEDGASRPTLSSESRTTTRHPFTRATA